MSRVVSALVVDGDPLSRAMLRALFEGFGCRVFVAMSKAEAIARTAAATFDLVCVDLDLCGPSAGEMAAEMAPLSFRVASSLDVAELPTGFHATLPWPIDRQGTAAIVDQAVIWRALRPMEAPSTQHALRLAEGLREAFTARPELLHLLRDAFDAAGECDQSDSEGVDRRPRAA